MKILVVDDNAKHRAAAQEQLGEHELAVFDNYTEALDALKEGCGYDVVLSDLLMPAEARTLGSDGLKFLGHEISAGFAVLFRAAKVGVPRVAVITDMNHHCHPMSAIIDSICPAYWRGEPDVFTVNNTRVLVAHAPMTAQGAKDWAQVLTSLL